VRGGRLNADAERERVEPGSRVAQTVGGQLRLWPNDCYPVKPKKTAKIHQFVVPRHGAGASSAPVAAFTKVRKDQIVRTPRCIIY